MSVADSALSPAAAAVNRISWVPPARSFVALSLINGALRILTLGIYHFWGKTEVRRRIWSAVRIDGEPIEYRGTGGELLRGFVIVFGLILLPLLIAGFAIAIFASFNSPLNAGYQSLAYLLFFALSGVGIHRARRYRLSRTRWRGIRGGQSGRPLRFAWTYLWTIALVPLTLGWILPWRTVRLHKALFNDTRFGDKAFTFTGVSGPLYKRFWLVWLSGMVLFSIAFGMVGAVVMQATIGGSIRLPNVTTGMIAQIVAIVFVALLIYALIRAWYGARVLNYFASQTRFQGAGFTLQATVPSLVWLTATNYLMRVLTLGILTPVAEARSTRYVVDRLTIDQPVDWKEIGQNPDVLLNTGEGLAEAFDVDAF
jgi:uncharacterized membrane protein YjgN (DUF898 family)